ncbi:hypothetical protein OIO90_000121 [Microbotryomycetes sp. JL221]|nr:hypothetical protein OIO90_000121 [Microbotryomycetes sp. JL221]
MARSQLHCLPGSVTHDLPSLDPQCLVVASYLQLLQPGGWDLVYTTDPGTSPSGSLPFLRLADGQELTGTAILTHLVRTSNYNNNESGAASSSSVDSLQQAEATAFHSLLDTTVLPLVLHSLFSLPQNWTFTRQLLVQHLNYPVRFWRPEQLRESARQLVEATHSAWWGMGGETEKEEEADRRKKRVLLETGVEGVKDRVNEERKDSRDRMRKVFGESKIAAAAREVFTALETTLAASSTPFFFSSASPTPLDAHMSALLSLVLYLPLPTPILADLINASFPRLWSHSALLRRTLWSEPPSKPRVLQRGHNTARSVLRDLVPMPWEWDSLSWLGLGHGSNVKRGSISSNANGETEKKSPAQLKQEREFRRKRWQFLAVVLVGTLGWGFGTGAFPWPFRLNRLLDQTGDDDDDEGWTWQADEDEDEGEEEEIAVEA